MDIGNRMKELRIQYGLTQQELADRAELTKGFISQLERNQNTPSISTLLDIIQCLGTTPAEFFADEELTIDEIYEVEKEGIVKLTNLKLEQLEAEHYNAVEKAKIKMILFFIFFLRQRDIF